MPKVIFRKMTKEENIDVIKWAFFEDNGSLDVHSYTIQYFKELASIDKDSESKEKIYEKIEQIVSADYDKYEQRITEEVERYNSLWSSYNEKYFTALCTYLKIKWPEDKKIIEASVGLIPVFPRYLDSFSFSISTGVADWKVIETVAHETLHFAWFEKWKELYPNCPRREYDSPYLPWEYSEMVVDPILNSGEFKEVFSSLFEEKAYDSFYDLTSNGENVMNSLKEIFEQNINIEEKIRLGFDYINSVKTPTQEDSKTLK